MTVAPTYSKHQAITTSDTADIPKFSNKTLCDAIYVGGAGVVPVMAEDGTVTNFTAVAGGYLYVKAKRVMATNLTASLLVALYL